jgi:hypothetical protein
LDRLLAAAKRRKGKKKLSRKKGLRIILTAEKVPSLLEGEQELTGEAEEVEELDLGSIDHGASLDMRRIPCCELIFPIVSRSFGCMTDYSIRRAQILGRSDELGARQR